MLSRLRIAALNALLRVRETVPVYRDREVWFVLVMPYGAAAVRIPETRA